jgi:hypothetical protein
VFEMILLHKEKEKENHIRGSDSMSFMQRMGEKERSSRPVGKKNGGNTRCFTAQRFGYYVH